jgi:hypothetical protein
MTLSAQVRNILPLNGPSNSSIFTSLAPQTTYLAATIIPQHHRLHLYLRHLLDSSVFDDPVSSGAQYPST